MKLSVFGEYGEFTIIACTGSPLRKNLMKLSPLGECVEGIKRLTLNKTPNENMRIRNTVNDINLSLYWRIFGLNKKIKILNLLPREYEM
jgi:hypothetical protein